MRSALAPILLGPINPVLSLDFIAGRYQSGNGAFSSPSDIPGWSFTRASVGTARDSGGNIISFASGAPRTTDLGMLVEESRTNLFLNSTVPVTQTITLGATGNYTITVWGTGSVAIAAGTGTITNAGSASSGSPRTVNCTVIGTITATITGSPSGVQVEAGSFGTALIVTAGSSASRALDLALPTISGITLAKGTARAQWKQSAQKTQVSGLLALDVGDATASRVQAFLNSTGKIGWRYSSASSDLVSQDGATTIGAGVHKLAVSWGPNGFNGYVDGVQDIAVTLAPGSAALDTLNLGNSISSHAALNDYLQRVILGSSETAPGQLAAFSQ